VVVGGSCCGANRSAPFHRLQPKVLERIANSVRDASARARKMARMSFKEKWGRPVREAVERMALDPEGLSARAIHAGLVSGAVDGIAPSDVPPKATISRWVGDHRRAAREAVGGAAETDTLLVIAARLRRKLKAQAAQASTAAEVRAIAAASRELAALDRELRRSEDPAPTRRAARPEPTTQDAEQRAFLEAMARGERPVSPTQV
jgi:hypothetical protein